MKQIEVDAFNRGVVAVLAIAGHTAQAIRTAPDFRPTCDGFAAEALAALAGEGRALMLDDPDADPAPELSEPDKPNNGEEVVSAIPESVE